LLAPCGNRMSKTLSDHEWNCLFPDLRLRLGEGLHWCPRAGGLWFVDIMERQLFFWPPGGAAAQPQSWPLPERVGWVIPVQGSDGLLLGLQSGVASFHPADGRLEEPLYRPWPAGSPLRLNDAKADAHGRIWAGSLKQDDESQPDGALFCIDARAATGHAVDAGYCVANGPAIHPDGRLFLHTDSVRRTIYAFDLAPVSGVLSGKRVWKELQGAEGYPDGMTFDAEGCLWLAHWAGACISRYSRDGALLRRVSLPTSHITNVCFGGAALDRLFVTSAWAGLAADQRAVQPLAGAVFEVDAQGVKGLPGLAALG